MNIAEDRIVLSEDIIQLKNFLTPELAQETLLFEQLATFEEKRNYAGKMYFLPESISTKLVERLKMFDINFSKLIMARLRTATHEDLNDFRSLVHTDHFSKKALCVYLHNSLYKNANEAGTLFWEHVHIKKRKMNLDNSRDIFLHSLIIERDTKDLSKWTEWLNCPFEENSAVFFDSLYFHSPPCPLFEKNIPGKRLTLDLFFD